MTVSGSWTCCDRVVVLCIRSDDAGGFSEAGRGDEALVGNLRRDAHGVHAVQVAQEIV